MEQWQQLSRVLRGSSEADLDQQLLPLLLTPDERDAILTRAEIFRLLLEGTQSQRQICQQLGVGIATVTRGSNTLKQYSEQEKTQLKRYLDQLYAQGNGSEV